MSEKMYLYLGRRDRRGVKVVTVLAGPVVPMTRLTDIGLLGLPADIGREVADIIHQNRIQYEPWVETVSNYQELKKRLEARGYSNLPIHSSPLYRETSLSRPPEVTAPPVSDRVMVQRPKIKR